MRPTHLTVLEVAAVCKATVVGVAGFEPATAGVKDPYPNMNYPGWI